LISHSQDNDYLLKTAIKVKAEYPDLWVGVNFLGYKPWDALNMYMPKIDGLWIDETLSTDIWDKRKYHGMVFGGLAFKYQKQPTDLQLACEAAVATTHVATTSGPGTGIEAGVQKIKFIRHHLGNHPMAIASGVTSDNVGNYAGDIDYLLVASSITQPRSEMIIYNKLDELIHALRNFQEPMI
jgi:hypothetical protein